MGLTFRERMVAYKDGRKIFSEAAFGIGVYVEQGGLGYPRIRSLEDLNLNLTPSREKEILRSFLDGDDSMACYYSLTPPKKDSPLLKTLKSVFTDTTKAEEVEKALNNTFQIKEK